MNKGGHKNEPTTKTFFDLGVNETSINTVAVRNQGLVKEVSWEFGKQGLVVAIDGGERLPESELLRLGMVIKG